MFKVLASGRKVNDVFDILTVEKSSDEFLNATAGLSNMSPSVCPKCHRDMISALIDSSEKSFINGRYICESSTPSEPVYFCASCRVTNPMKD